MNTVREIFSRWIPTFLASISMPGWGHASSGSLEPGNDVKNSLHAKPRVTLPSPINANRRNVFASHSSHASHASHASHYSSSGGDTYVPSYQEPTPATVAPPPKAPPAKAPASNPRSNSTPAKSTAQTLAALVMRVQLALNSRRICECDITGTMTPETKDALKKFQKAQGLNVTGKMDTETLNRLGVALP